jgi:uncharacterized NAD-dependent epimerase/dehydratase family protein
MSAPATRHRYVVHAEGEFGHFSSKTALGVIRYGGDSVVAVLDSTRAGRSVAEWLGPRYDIPVVATLHEALTHGPTAMLVGLTTAGGRIPASWLAVLHAAIEHGLHIVSGLHQYISDDPELKAAADRHGVTLTDHRRPPEHQEIARGRTHRPGSRVVLTVGTDCSIGKMTAALELRGAARDAGLDAVFVATGQTGIMIEGWGVAVDGVASDFVTGTAERLVEQAEDMGDWIFVEGQASLDHPQYSPVTIGLVHGTTPHAMILVHEAGREFHLGWRGRPEHPAAALKPLVDTIRSYETVASWVAPSRVLGIALRTTHLDEPDARAEISRVEAETGLTTDDPVRFGAERLLEALREGLADLP